MEQVTLTVETSSRKTEISIAHGAVLREALLSNGLSPYKEQKKLLNCRGLGLCGTCLVWIKEKETFWQRRSCQIRCYQDSEIRLE